MKIDLKSVSKKFNEQKIIDHREELEKAVTIFVHAILAKIELGEVHDKLSGVDSPAEVVINQYSRDLSDRLYNDEAKAVLDSLRHAFSSFAYGGLHQLFTRQENEVWYPRIVLDEELKPNDIDKLPGEIILYRGTDFVELNSETYGQSWTTSKNVAHDFAFKHYANQPWFEESQRLILSAKISKEHVYYSNQSREFEVVVDTSKLADVRKYT